GDRCGFVVGGGRPAGGINPGMPQKCGEFCLSAAVCREGLVDLGDPSVKIPPPATSLRFDQLGALGRVLFVGQPAVGGQLLFTDGQLLERAFCRGQLALGLCQPTIERGIPLGSPVGWAVPTASFPGSGLWPEIETGGLGGPVTTSNLRACGGEFSGRLI